MSKASGLLAPVRSILAAIWSVVWPILRPVVRAVVFGARLLERITSPVAGAYNRSLGRFYGEMTGLQFLLLVVGLVIIVVGPLVLEGFGKEQLARAFIPAAIWAIFAMSWDIQSGYTGYISFGHSILSGAAAYAMGMLVWHTDVLDVIAGLPAAGAVNAVPYLWNVEVILTMLFGVVAAVTVGMLIALPSLRLKGPYFSLLTFVGVLLFTRLIPPFSEWTGGTQEGISLLRYAGPDFSMFAIDPDLIFFNYLNVLIPLLVIAFVLVTIARSNVGLALMAIRENEPAVSAAGLNPTKFKLWSFLVSSIPMGIGGVLLAHSLNTISMRELVIADNSIEMIAIAVVGGISSIVGPLFGAFGFILLEKDLLNTVLHAVPFVGDQQKFLFLWLIVIAVLIFARNGLFRGLWHLVGRVGGESE